MQDIVRENKLNKDIMITLKVDIQKLKRLVKTQYDTIDSLTLSLDKSKKERKKASAEFHEAQLHIERLRSELSQLENSFETSMEKLKHELQRSGIYQTEIDRLEGKIHSLEIRASSNFEELTPRPDIRPVRTT